MFQHFSEPARQVVVLAQDESRALKHNQIATEHLLLGLLRKPEGIAAKVLASLAITLDEVRPSVIRIVGRGHEEATTGMIPFTPHAKEVLELTLHESLEMGDAEILPEHILLALARVGEGVAARVLLDFGADTKTIRDEVLELRQPGV